MRAAAGVAGAAAGSTRRRTATRVAQPHRAGGRQRLRQRARRPGTPTQHHARHAAAGGRAVLAALGDEMAMRLRRGDDERARDYLQRATQFGRADRAARRRGHARHPREGRRRRCESAWPPTRSACDRKDALRRRRARQRVRGRPGARRHAACARREDHRRQARKSPDGRDRRRVRAATDVATVDAHGDAGRVRALRRRHRPRILAVPRTRVAAAHRQAARLARAGLRQAEDATGGLRLAAKMPRPTRTGRAATAQALAPADAAERSAVPRRRRQRRAAQRSPTWLRDGCRSPARVGAGRSRGTIERRTRLRRRRLPPGSRLTLSAVGCATRMATADA